MNALTHAPILAAAERLLSKRFDREVCLGDVACLSEDGRRNLLLRCRDLSGGSPVNVIIKKVVVDTYNPEDAASWDTRRFFSDWAGAEFLSAVLDNARSPRFYGGDYSLGFFILEDLGDQRSLVEPLLEEDPSTAERALLTFSACLGSLHAGTIGQSATFEKLLGFPQELDTMITTIEDPGPFLSYIHGDPCPDNVSWNGDELRLIDFEFGGFGHALIDGTYGRMLFPTCWCANSLPTGVVSRMEAVYRAELAKRCPEAQEDRIFEAALARVCGFWLLSTMSRDLARAVEADRTWGIATMRQRLLARLQAFITTAEECNELPAFRGVASRLLKVLHKAWPETPQLPLYPAFQRASSKESAT